MSTERLIEGASRFISASAGPCYWNDVGGSRPAHRANAMLVCTAIRGAVLGAVLFTGEGRALAQEVPPPEFVGPPVNLDRSNAPDTEQRTARVHVDGPPGLRLEQLTVSNTDEWELVCTAPCDASVATAFRYRISGGGVRTSNPFDMRASDGEREVLRAEGGSTALFAVGVSGLVVGGAALAAGAYALLVVGVGALTPAPGEGAGSMGSPSGFLPGGLLLTIGGALVAGGGWALLNANRAAKVSQELVATQAPLAGDGWRTTVWRREQGMRGPSARVVALPIVSVSF